ncbi:MAG: hypothetical protein R2762_25675 [Bryobacteraceae bacterium]
MPQNMLVFVFLLTASAIPAFGAEDTPELAPATRTVKGELVQWKIQGLAGVLALRTEEPGLLRCRVLAGSRLMRAGIRIHPHGVRLGDTVEVLGYFSGASCTVVELHIRPFQGERKMVNGKFRSPLYPRSYLDALWARGLLTFSGTVGRMNDGRMVIRTRRRGERSFALRDDTVFQNEGRQVERDTLESFTRVFVRASRTADGDLEAYQVMWGQILRPEH